MVDITIDSRWGLSSAERRSARALLRAVSIVLMVALRSVAWAQDPASALPPQSLADALETFAREAGYQLVYRTEVAEGLKTLGAQAGLSAEEKLRQLLRGTGLSFAFINDR